MRSKKIAEGASYSTVIGIPGLFRLMGASYLTVIGILGLFRLMRAS
jgi:hypothetical protein